MRVLPWVLALVVLSTVAASSPATAAGDCPPKTVDLPDVDVRTNPDCTVDVVLFGDMACLGNQSSKTSQVGPARVTYHYCTGPTAMSASGPCPETGLESAILDVAVLIHSDCTADVVLFRNINCVGPWVSKIDETIGPVQVIVYFCGPPGGT